MKLLWATVRAPSGEFNLEMETPWNKVGILEERAQLRNDGKGGAEPLRTARRWWGSRLAFDETCRMPQGSGRGGTEWPAPAPKRERLQAQTDHRPAPTPVPVDWRCRGPGRELERVMRAGRAQLVQTEGSLAPTKLVASDPYRRDRLRVARAVMRWDGGMASGPRVGRAVASIVCKRCVRANDRSGEGRSVR